MLWLSIFAFVTAIGFLVKSLEIRKTSLSIPYSLLALCFLCLGFLFLPAPLPGMTAQGMGWLAVLFSGIYLSLQYAKQIHEKLTPWKWLPFPHLRVLSPEIREVLTAFERLCAKRVGALVVLERKNSLEVFFPKGMRLDAEVKAEILQSFFSTSSPLHDGAIIVAKGRIKAVRVVLPLSESLDLPEGIGTRHRSAIGISEKTDAIALVVSEERGTISLAYRGGFFPSENMQELIGMLQAALRGRVPAPKKSLRVQVHAENVF